MQQNNFPRGVEVITGAVIRNKKGEILLMTSPKWHEKWVVPGGHVEPGETIMDAVVREVKEELGLTVKPVDILFSREIINDPNFHRPAHFISFVCILDLKNDQIQISPDTREVSSYKWMLPEDIPHKNLAGNMEEIIEKYIEYYKSQKNNEF